MTKKSNLQVGENKNSIAEIFFWLFVLVSILEIIAEYFPNKVYVFIFKPLIIPFLILLYFKTSSIVNPLFITALFFSWIANIFYIYIEYYLMIIASIFFMMYRLLIIKIVLEHIVIKSLTSVLLSIIPFALLVFYTFSLIYEEMGLNIIMYALQGLLVVVLGAISLSNFLSNPGQDCGFWLLISSILFMFNLLFIFIRIFYFEFELFQPLLMSFYIFGQYSLYKFVVLSEDNAIVGSEN